MSSKRVLIVGYPADHHIGSHLLEAMAPADLNGKICDAGAAMRSSRLELRLSWRLRSHRPPRLNTFSRHVLAVGRDFRPHYVLVTGITAPNADTLCELGKLGSVCVNYLTDDPWNPNRYARWFFEALPCYARVFSPRRANLAQLAGLGCQAQYLPFAYAPGQHFQEAPPEHLRAQFECDVLFYGGADRDRVPYIEALIKAGLNVHLYGGYWNRYPKLQRAFRGVANTQTLRWAIAGARITLCLVRRANRDGHVMRTFEAPAMGACMLTEDTEEHRAIIGADGEAVVYFRSVEDMVGKARKLLESDAYRTQLAHNAYERIVGGKNTYLDRLRTMITTLQADA